MRSSTFAILLVLILAVATALLAGFVQGLAESVHELQDVQRVMLRTVDR